MSEPKATPAIVELKFPINDSAGQKITQITMRRPKVRDMQTAQKTGNTAADQEINMFASLTGLAPNDLAELDMADYLQLQQAYSNFLS